MNRSSTDPGNPNCCAICLNPFKDPRIVGDCLHSFCLHCLKGYIGQLPDCGTFLCPLCRQECLVPEQGVDSLGVNREVEIPKPQCSEELRTTQDNARETTYGKKPKPSKGVPPSSMTDQLKKQPVTKGNEPPCSVCSTIGSWRFCKNCHDIYLCERCTEAHDSKPITRDHKLLGVCRHHGKPAEFYCKNCSCEACSVCLISMHPGENHAILSMFDIFTTALDALKGLEEDVNTTLAEVNGCQKMIGDIDSKIKGHYATQIGKKNSETKKKSAEEQQQLQQVQREIESTKQKLKELQLKETEIKKRQTKMAQDAKADIAKDQAAEAASTQKVAALMRELSDVKKELSNGFATSQGLLKISTFTADNVNLLQATAISVHGVMMLANIKASEAKKAKQDMASLIKAQFFFHERHSDGLILSENDTVASWSISKNKHQRRQWAAMQGQGFRFPMQGNNQHGAVMIQQLIAIGDMVEIEINRKPSNPNQQLFVGSVREPSMYAGFANTKPESVDFTYLQQCFGMLASYGDFMNVGFAYGLAMCSCNSLFPHHVNTYTLEIWRTEDGHVHIGIKGDGDVVVLKTYKSAKQSDLYICFIFGEDITELKIGKQTGKRGQPRDNNEKQKQFYAGGPVGAAWN